MSGAKASVVVRSINIRSVLYTYIRLTSFNEHTEDQYQLDEKANFALEPGSADPKTPV